MSESTTTRKSKYDLSGFAILKVPSTVYFILKKKAIEQNIEWSELARDYLVAMIKQRSE